MKATRSDQVVLQYDHLAGRSSVLTAVSPRTAIHDETFTTPASPGNAWALTAEPGDPVAFWDEGRTYQPTPDATWQLLVDDETALALIGTTIHWLPRNDPAMRPGALALAAVQAAQLRPGPFDTWIAGEAALPTGGRRHLVAERGVVKSDIAFLGYWSYGVTRSPATVSIPPQETPLATPPAAAMHEDEDAFRRRSPSSQRR